MALLVVDVHMCALVRHGLNDGLRAEEPPEAAGDRQRRFVFMISCVHVYSSTQGIFLFIKGKVHTNMDIIPLFLSSLCKPIRLSFSVQYKSRNFEVSAGRCFPCNVNEW